MPHWSEGVLTVLDTETTGIDTSTARIVSLAILRVAPDGSVLPGSFSSIVNPGVEIPEEAAAVHGITTERARAEGVPIDWALRAAATVMEFLRTEDAPLLIYNAPFDLPLLLAEGARHGVPIPAGLPIFDPLCCDRYLDRYRRGGRKLADLSACYKVSLTDAHTAGVDALATVGVARALVKAFPDPLATSSLAELQDLQREWYASWRDDINAYWERTGKPQRARGEWPLGETTQVASA